MIIEPASCHCGNISVELRFSKELSAYVPRACDCDFCIKHGAATLANRDRLAPSQIASPKLLSSPEKIERWKKLWFPDVVLDRESAS